MWSGKRRLLRLWKTAQAMLAQAVFGFPGRKLRVVGVTGTDGKTTTVHLAVRALESAGYTVGAVSTIRYQVGTRVWTNRSKLTTPGPWELAKLLAHMVRAGCHYVVLECSSHRLDQGGLWGIPFDVAVITNVTREHFDYHQNVDDYASAKRRLFAALRHPPKILPPRRGVDAGGVLSTVAIANLDDERARVMLTEAAQRRYGFTVEDSTDWESAATAPTLVLVTARGVEEPQNGSSATVSPSLFLVRAGSEEALLRLQLPGRVNLANMLAAIAVGVSQGIPLAQVTRELSEVERIPGRMDIVSQHQPFTVLVDYAVTPAAFSALYAELKKWKTPPAKLLHVFGAAGNRDRGKRPLLGELAGQHADLVILTDEDPYGEDPEQILNDLEAGVVAAGKKLGESLLRIRDRRLAIREALRRARPGDIVVVSGKGAEETMAIGRQRIPWNDRLVVTEELQQSSNG